MKSISLLTLFLAFLACAGTSGADWYLSPVGDDVKPGTKEAPFQSLGRAQLAVREAVAVGLEADLTVWLSAGTYELREPLAFTSADATADAAVVYAAEEGQRVVLSGGAEITGWQEAADGRWRAALPAGLPPFRQLYADGQRLTRGRYPDEGFLHLGMVSEDVMAFQLEETPPAFVAPSAELVVIQHWAIARAPIEFVKGRMMKTRVPVGWIGHGPALTAIPGKPCWLENIDRFTDCPGEWFLDEAKGEVVYCGKPGQDPNAMQFVAPRIGALLLVEGTEAEPVRNLQFKGLTFSYSGWALPEFGYMGIQAGHHGTTLEAPAHALPAAIGFSNARGCSLEDCTVAHLGAGGVAFGAGCRENSVRGCTVEDIGGNGIMVGWRDQTVLCEGKGDGSLSGDWARAEQTPRDNVIAGNVVRRCGAELHGCVGIFDAFSAGTRIEHNLVEDMPYTGISSGFRWNTSETSQRGGRIAYNHIHDVMKFLADGGGIYTLGYQPGAVLEGNHIHDVGRSAFAQGGAPNNGIFFDQGSKGFLIDKQIIYATSGKAIRYNQTGEENMTWGENYFDVAPDSADFPAVLAAKAGPEAARP